MVFRVQDTLHDRQIVIEDKDAPGLLEAIIESDEFQRLKHIQQISYSSEAFPAAKHTRYLHSLGVYYLADQMLQQIKEQHPQTYDPYQARVVRVRALLHDIGHGPRSHSWEGVMKSLGHKRGHEEWGYHIISGDTEIGRILREYDESLYEDVRSSFLREEPASFWDTIIASQFDADRLDYIQRDTNNAGVAVGINEGHILQNIKLSYVSDTDDVVIAFDPKAEESVNQFLYSRKMMYSTISHNKHSESSDALMQHVFKRAQKIFREHGAKSLGFNPNDPHVRVIMAAPDDVSVEDYLYLEDSVLSAFIKKLAASKDTRLEDLPRLAKLLTRSKSLTVFDFARELPQKTESAMTRAVEIFDEMRKEYSNNFSGSFVKCKPAYKNTKNPFDKIWIVNGGEVVEISQRATMPDDIHVGFVFSESKELIGNFKECLKSDPQLKSEFGGSYGAPARAVLMPQVA